MPEAKSRAAGTGMSMGVYGKQDQPQAISTIEIVAIVLSVLWMLIVTYFFVTMDTPADRESAPVDFLMTLLGVFLPVALIWVAASAARTARTMREESARLQAAIDGMRHAYVEQQQMAGMSIKRSMEAKIDSISKAQERAEAVIAGMAVARPDTEASPVTQTQPAPRPEMEMSDQQPLALGTPAEALPLSEPLTIGEFIRAVNFPENEKDREGFRTLRRALKDRTAARLINAAQDVLTLMSQEGIYTDDLTPDRARPEIWRAFAKGERGRSIASLGGIRDRSSLALCAGRMRSDPVFKDAVHHFLRQFDRTFAEAEPRMTDVEVSQLGNTRTARAFMLLGRVTGTFD
jgi:hypothetical protein